MVYFECGQILFGLARRGLTAGKTNLVEASRSGYLKFRSGCIGIVRPSPILAELEGKFDIPASSIESAPPTQRTKEFNRKVKDCLWTGQWKPWSFD